MASFLLSFLEYFLLGTLFQAIAPAIALATFSFSCRLSSSFKQPFPHYFSR
jgi:hypothetical protein